MPEVSAIQQTGWAFPPVFERYSRRSQTQTGLENLAKCMKIMLATQPGERNQHSDYGCDLSGYAFQSLSYELLEEVEEIVDNSITNHEPRIGIQDIQVAPDQNSDGTLIVQVQYSTETGEIALSQIPLNLNTSQLINF